MTDLIWTHKLRKNVFNQLLTPSRAAFALLRLNRCAAAFMARV
jgi:hypothetical protein